MIPIREGVPIREQRPPLRVPWPPHLVIRLAEPLLRRLAKARYRAKERRLRDLFLELRGCDSRIALEAVLGQPVYCMSGEQAGTFDRHGSIRHPDHIEVYHAGGCSIDMLFYLDQNRFELCGAPALGAIEVWLMGLDHRQSGNGRPAMPSKGNT